MSGSDTTCDVYLSDGKHQTYNVAQRKVRVDKATGLFPSNIHVHVLWQTNFATAGTALHEIGRKQKHRGAKFVVIFDPPYKLGHDASSWKRGGLRPAVAASESERFGVNCGKYDVSTIDSYYFFALGLVSHCFRAQQGAGHKVHLMLKGQNKKADESKNAAMDTITQSQKYINAALSLGYEITEHRELETWGGRTPSWLLSLKLLGA